MKDQFKINLNRLWCAHIIDELIKNDIVDFFLCPGMRNAPLISAVLENEKINVHRGMDERAQAYQALGTSKVTGRASVLICTSGTAVANFYPAIIEASLTGTPLLVISADRPIELVKSGANQAIEQKGILTPYVANELHLPPPEEKLAPRALRKMIAHLISEGHIQKRPLHLNVPLREPLDLTPESISPDYLKQSVVAFENKQPATVTLLPQLSLSQKDQEILHARISKALHPLVVVGTLPSGKDKSSLIEWIDQSHSPLFLDATSGLKYRYPVGERALPGFDHPEVLRMIEDEGIDLILHIGGPVVSKHYYQFLSSHPEVEVIHVHDSFLMNDPSFSVDWRIFADPLDIMKSLPVVNGEMKKSLLESSKKLIVDKSKMIDEAPLSNPFVSKKLIDLIPDNSVLAIGNSMSIRSFDSYGSLTCRKDLTIISNRGASGIEGLVATTIGAAKALNKAATLVLGDVSLIHDLNSLSLLSPSSVPVRIIVLNNHGGGIFRLLPIAKDEKTLEMIETPHHYEFSSICQMFKLPYTKISTTQEYEKLCSVKVLNSELIEVAISNEDNDELYRKLKTIRIS